MDEKDTNRLEAFSDGVFAVAITLLVLDIKLPYADSSGKLLGNSELWQAIFEQWPMLLAFVTSFFTIGIMWLNHHRIFKHIKHSDTSLVFLNIILLMLIVFIPVPTALLVEYITHPELNTAALLYSGTFFAMALCFNLLWRYASYKGRLLGQQVDMDGVNKISRQYLFGPLVYIIALAIAWINTPASLIFNLLLAIFFALPDTPMKPGKKDQDPQLPMSESV
ncbi:DUF1211 domain-containing membrane protein [Dictyobacter vulcani]|uniref:DUF1211 domain-containing membrane protein n=1 Tax=Dictyobacter vulcani TaxID=2607529 RepID=A0A5J4KWF1_9CHLR|nr:TMEM175 family protein [Dictyobacter vulcani]GER90857.1 DUF1211 domain-containing membrane protein [Dictyobacter vulcani]